jgi:hypothetical protein
MKELKFLEYFENRHKGFASNMLLKYMRAYKTLSGDVEWISECIRKDCEERTRWDKSQQVGQMLLAIRDTNALREAIDYYVEWEKLSFAEKEKIKQKNSKVYIENSMAGKEPTEKQIAFIESKGFEVPGDKLACSKLISQIINENL